jgi:ribosomal-protein-alanine N-acetyltransferase
MSHLLTTRLVLDPLSLDDVADLFEARGDPEVMSFWDWPADPNPDITRAVIVQMLAEVDAGRALYWTIRLRTDRSFVGVCDLGELGPSPSADLGFMLARRWWGSGLAGEAIVSVLEHARALGITSVHARVAVQNERSVRLLQRLGFVSIESLAHFEVRPGVFRDSYRVQKTL